MTFSKLGIALETSRTLEPQSGKEIVVYSPKINPNSGNEYPVSLPQSSRREGLYIIGATGTGKSTLIENLILQDIEQGLGVCLLDPHGDLTYAVLSRMKKRLEDVILIDLADKQFVAGFNLFHCENPTDAFEAENVVSAVMHILDKVYHISRTTPQMHQYFINITNTLLYNPDCSVLDIPRLLTDDAFRMQLVSNVPDEHIRWFWLDFYNNRNKSHRDDEISATVNKLDEFFGRVLKPWFGHAKNTISMRDIMDDRKILLVKLNARWQSMTNLIGSIIIAQILDAAYSRSDIPVNKRKQFNVYADEFQRFASEDFATLFTEARKYGIGITIAHQVAEQLDSTIRATCKQAANLVVFRVSSDNAKDVAGEFDCSPQPGIPHYEPLKTPVMEPIQYMVSHGVHPIEHTRKFIESYGKQLVESAKLEEELERDSRHEVARYEHDLVAGVRYIAPPMIKVTRDSRMTLKSLNSLFYQAMMAGKEGRNPDDIPLPYGLVDYFIRALVPEKSLYFTWMEGYTSFLTQHNMQPVIDRNARMWELKNMLAELPAYQSNKLLPLQRKQEIAEKNLPQAIRRYLMMELLAVREHLVIVKKGFYYYPVVLLHPDWQGNPPEAPYYLYHHDKTNSYTLYSFQPYSIENIEPVHLDVYGCPSFNSWEEIITFYSQLLGPDYFKKFSLQRLWFTVGNTLYDRNWWQKQRSRVSVLMHYKNYYGKQHDPSIVELDTWVLKPGVERTWYTTAMLETEIISRIGGHGGQDRHGGQDTLVKLINYTHLQKELDDVNDAYNQAFWGQKELQKATDEVATEVQAVTAKIQRELFLLEQIEAEKKEYDLYVTDFEEQVRHVKRELASSPVETDSGLMQEVPTEIPTSEVELRIANQLKQLKRYTARVRIESGEYTIKTIEPTGHIKEHELEERIAAIQKQNLDKKYLRSRADVVAEILQRQQSFQAGQLATQPPQRYVRQVPLHEN